MRLFETSVVVLTMPVPFLLIDGYNLIHAAGLARRTCGPGDLERIRGQLLGKLARRLSVEERRRCTVVFDAIDAPPGLPGRMRHEEMIVLFAEPGHEADELIETLVRQHSSPRQVTIVSSDHRLQNAIRRRKGKSIESEAFLNHLESPHRRLDAAPRTPSLKPDAANELDFWLDEFRSVSPDTIQESLQSESPEVKSDWDQRVDQLQRQLQDSQALDEWLDQSDNQRRQSKKKSTGDSAS